MNALSIEPLSVSVQLACEPAVAFEHFTGNFASWWPLATHSVGQESANDCGIELYPGGKIWERTTTGERHLWGHVLDCEDPRSLSFTWHPGRPIETAQAVEIRWTPQASTESSEGGPPRTELVLEHGDWHVFGPAAEHARAQYRDGWPMVLERFRHSVEAAASDSSNPSPL